MTFEYDWALNHLPLGGLLMSDDIGWNRAFPNFVRAHKDSVRCLSKKGLGLLVRLK